MGDITGIEWADSTVNAWEGCEKVSPACKACYAEICSPVRAMEMRIGEFLMVEPSADGKRRLKMWGPSGIRYEMVDWERKLLALNRKARTKRMAAELVGAPYHRPRIFINSLSDTFEDFHGDVYKLVGGDPEIVAHSLDDLRRRLFAALEECTELDSLLLTKRPENVLRMAPWSWGGRLEKTSVRWPSHVWIGTTVENQEYADKRIPDLLKVPARVRFLSVEPLLAAVNLAPHMRRVLHANDGRLLLNTDPGVESVGGTWRPGISWVIVGSESGRSPRTMADEWVRQLRDQCVENGVAFFYKQQLDAQKRVVSLPVLDGKQWTETPITRP